MISFPFNIIYLFNFPKNNVNVLGISKLHPKHTACTLTTKHFFFL